ncbi:hypothetical protein BKA62DRAFT_707605 [Auriculariales sp. MPI-PUGE-AT-0066]|nr:hypothetical protein BKA62DRAFT_707605 [Auriculariales sp. MPI-PUGE-AT-0066]
MRSAVRSGARLQLRSVNDQDCSEPLLSCQKACTGAFTALCFSLHAMRPVRRAALVLGLFCGRAVSLDGGIDAVTPVVQFLAPSASENSTTCAPLSFSWLSRLPEGTIAASASFTLELLPVDSGEPTSTVVVSGSTLTSNSRRPNSTPTTPGLRQRVSREPITLRSGLLARQGEFAVNQLEAAAGWYILQGTNAIPTDAGIAFLSSQPFAVSEGGETSCLQSAAAQVSPTQTPAPSSSTPSPSDTESKRLDATGNHVGVIAGVVIGGFCTTLVVLGLVYLLYRRMRPPSSRHGGSDNGDSDSVAQWRDSRAAAWRHFTVRPLPAHTTPATEKQAREREEDEEERARLADLANMLRQAGIQEGIGARRAEALHAQQFELSGIERRDSDSFRTP